MAIKAIIQSITYDPQKDMLYLAVHPDRPSVTRGNRHDVLVMYDEADRQTLVGIEVMDFAAHLVPLLYKPGVVPDLPERFTVVGADIENADLRTVFEWCYHRYVLPLLKMGVAA
ncbi:MAG: DUF2283 domain-containing protein [Abditibacteriales bacterium]|nr:DUF2283 domain-containing protein [Abditibacteriales bacterium]MDW8368277.1 DUF2283 domain-containing protein [Abditibacteriales bacterium]